MFRWGAQAAGNWQHAVFNCIHLGSTCNTESDVCSFWINIKNFEVILKQLVSYLKTVKEFCFFPPVKKTFVITLLPFHFVRRGKIICQTSCNRVASGEIITIINGLLHLSGAFHYNYWLFPFLSHTLLFLYWIRAGSASGKVAAKQKNKA